MKINRIKFNFFCTFLLSFTIFSVYFIDKKVAHYIAQINVHENFIYFLLLYETPKWISYFPLVLFGLSPLMILTTVYIIYYKKIVSKFYITLFLLAITLNISAGIKIIFKFIFSRNNVNHFLKTQNDDFKWLQDFHSLSAFPSGHTIITVSFFTILWLIYPRYKLIYIFTSLLIILSLVFLKFHFISDISSAVFAGCLISYFVYFSFKFFAKKEYAQLI